MSRRAIIRAAVVLVGAFGFAGMAKAGTVDVPFSGNIPATCTFGTATPGALALGSSPNLLEASSTAGTSGQVTVSCNTTATLTVGEPTRTGGTGATNLDSGNYYGAIISDGTSTAGSAHAVSVGWQGVSAGSLNIAPGNATINVSMVRDAGAGVVIGAGTYNYKVTITSTP